MHRLCIAVPSQKRCRGTLNSGYIWIKTEIKQFCFSFISDVTTALQYTMADPGGHSPKCPIKYFFYPKKKNFRTNLPAPWVVIMQKGVHLQGLWPPHQGLFPWTRWETLIGSWSTITIWPQLVAVDPLVTVQWQTHWCGWCWNRKWNRQVKLTRTSVWSVMSYGNVL